MRSMRTREVLGHRNLLGLRFLSSLHRSILRIVPTLSGYKGIQRSHQISICHPRYVERQACRIALPCGVAPDISRDILRRGRVNVALTTRVQLRNVSVIF